MNGDELRAALTFHGPRFTVHDAPGLFVPAIEEGGEGREAVSFFLKVRRGGDAVLCCCCHFPVPFSH